MNFIRLFTRRPVTTIMLFGMFLMFGVYAYLNLAKDQFPAVEIPYVLVTTVYPGAGPEEVETQVTKKIEEAVASVSGLKSQESISQENLSIVVAEFELSVDADIAENDVRSKLDQIVNDLPGDAHKPMTAQYDLSAMPIAQIAVLAPRPIEEIYQLVDEKMVDRFTQIQGLAKVDVFGKKEREIVIAVSSKKLEAFGLSIVDVNDMIAAFNMKLPAGRIIEGEQEINVKLQGDFPSLEAIESLEIPISSGIIRLSDVATVEDSFEEVRSMARMNGESAIGISLTKASDANTLEIMKRVRKLVQQLEQEIPHDYKLVMAKDTSTVIRDSVNDVIANLVLGILLTAGVLLLFLHDFRVTIIATITLPVAVIATFTLVWASGYTANMMSLMALALSVGVLVANVIVVLENIQRHLKETGESPLYASESGTSEIMVAVFGSALTNMAVFLPIATMSSLVGRFFREFGFTTVYATLFSLLLSFTLTPMLASRMLREHGTHSGFLAWFGKYWEALYSFGERCYTDTLKIALRWRWLTILAAILLFLGSFISLKWIGAEFMTKADEGEVSITVEKAVDESLEGTGYTILLLEERLKTFAYIDRFYTTIGSDEGSTTGVNEGSITVQLVPVKQRALTTNQAAEEFRRTFADIPGVKLTIEPVALGPGSGEKPISIDIIGQNTDELFRVADQLIAILTQVPGAVDVDMNWRLGKPEVRVTPDYRRCADYGITSAQLAMILRTSFTGNVGSVYRVSGEEYDIRVKLSEEDRTDAAAIGALPIQTPKGMVRLDALSTIEFVEGPSKIYRTNRQRSVTVGANVAVGANVGNIMQSVQARMGEIALPADITIQWGGDTEMMTEAGIAMGIALFLAIAMTYMLLSILLESAVHSLTIMSTVPLALIGVLVSLAITGKTLNIFSVMGIIMLVGIVVNNGLLMIDYIEELRRRGERWRDVLIPACVVKLRPILMTNVAIMCSMLPLALGIGQGGEMRAPMAIVSIGGIFSSTFMTLYIVPALYSMVESFREDIALRYHRGADDEKRLQDHPTEFPQPEQKLLPENL